MKEDFSLKVKVDAERPDFRVFGCYFFGDDFHEYDSEGDSFPVSSRKWTELYMCSREHKNLWFDICWVEKDDKTILKTTSDKIETVNIIAYFLAKETNGTVFDEKNNPVILESLMKNMGNFELESRLLLAEKSIWRKSSEANHYPNLDIEEL